MKKRKKRTKIGNRSSLFFLRLFIALCVAGSLAAHSAGKKKQKTPETYSVVAGTVFREPGFSLPDAEVTLAAAPAVGAPPSGKKLSFITNTRGEFAFRVPAVKADYVVTASAKGFIRQQKTIEVRPEERIDVTFMLVPESNK